MEDGEEDAEDEDDGEDGGDEEEHSRAGVDTEILEEDAEEVDSSRPLTWPFTWLGRRRLLARVEAASHGFVKSSAVSTTTEASPAVTTTTAATGADKWTRSLAFGNCVAKNTTKTGSSGVFKPFPVESIMQCGTIRTTHRHAMKKSQEASKFSDFGTAHATATSRLRRILLLLLISVADAGADGVRPPAVAPSVTAANTGRSASCWRSHFRGLTKL